MTVTVLGQGEVLSAAADVALDNHTNLRKVLADVLAEPMNEAVLPKGKYRITAIITIHKEDEDNAVTPLSDD